MNVLNNFAVLNKTYKCKVIKIAKTYLLLEFNGLSGICHISQVSDYLVLDLNKLFKLHNEYFFKLIDFNDEQNVYNFSYKEIHPKFLKHHKTIIPSQTGFTKLYENTMKKLYE